MILHVLRPRKTNNFPKVSKVFPKTTPKWTKPWSEAINIYVVDIHVQDTLQNGQKHVEAMLEAIL